MEKNENPKSRKHENTIIIMISRLWLDKTLLNHDVVHVVLYATVPLPAEDWILLRTWSACYPDVVDMYTLCPPASKKIQKA